jgi:hypothetical protein
MQVFLGDIVTLRNETHDEEAPTFVTGQIKGIVLTESKQVERIYIHNMAAGFEMAKGWKFLDNETEEEDD